MGDLLRLEAYRRPAKKSSKATYFTRTELNQLLSVYSRRVASGEWRDYAIDHRAGIAVFSVFRSTHERPLYAVAKRASGKQIEYVVFSDRQRLARAGSLSECLRIFEKKLRVVV
ncbi:DUF2794 domain-containing protein [Algihabitans albus]|uniref:DUF2794 domain-containing protein n=1 Tax=Algihabitans albus TaxID=2164067 RepID=UPI0035D11892